MSDRFQLAAGAYLVYGIVYWIGGLYLLWHGVGVMGSASDRGRTSLVFWALLGLVPLLLIPYLLHARRAWFERWILSRRDFARIVALFLVFRAYKVGQVAASPYGASVPAPWGDSVSFRIGAVVFLVVTVGALILVARAAWTGEEDTGPAPSPRDFNA